MKLSGPIGSDQFGLSEDMAFHGSDETLSCGWREGPNQDIERVDPERVMMCAGGRLRPVPPDFSPIS